MYQQTGKPFRAIRLLKDTYKNLESSNGLNHPYTLTSMLNLANGYRSIGDAEKAMPLYKQTLEIMKATLGENAEMTLNAMGNLASLYKDSGQSRHCNSHVERKARANQNDIRPQAS